MSWAANLWAGFGFETGGEIIVGMNNHTGLLFSIQDLISNPRLTRWCAFQQESATIGLGLGGSMGTNFVVGYNATVPGDFDGASVGLDFSIDLALGKLDKYFRNLPEMIDLMGIAKKFDRTWMSVADKLKQYEADRMLVKTVTENLVKNQAGLREALKGESALLSFPLPISSGLRLSVKVKAENTTILSFDAMDLSRQ